MQTRYGQCSRLEHLWWVCLNAIWYRLHRCRPVIFYKDKYAWQEVYIQLRPMPIPGRRPPGYLTVVSIGDGFHTYSTDQGMIDGVRVRQTLACYLWEEFKE